MPSAKRIAALLHTFQYTGMRPSADSRDRDRAKAIETPTINKNDGKIRSVGVAPFHSACSSGGETADHVPGSFKRIIAAIVIPRKTSSETSRSGAGSRSLGSARSLWLFRFPIQKLP